MARRRTGRGKVPEPRLRLPRVASRSCACASTARARPTWASRSRRSAGRWRLMFGERERVDSMSTAEIEYNGHRAGPLGQDRATPAGPRRTSSCAPALGTSERIPPPALVSSFRCPTSKFLAEVAGPQGLNRVDRLRSITVTGHAGARRLARRGAQRDLEQFRTRGMLPPEAKHRLSTAKVEGVQGDRPARSSSPSAWRCSWCSWCWRRSSKAGSMRRSRSCWPCRWR
jgi:hypothetical protein